jgi:hypothetical protein
MQRRLLRAAALAGTTAILGLGPVGCGNGSGPSVTVEGDVALAYVKRSTALSLNPTNGAPSAAGGDLMIREKSSASAPEHNITTQFTRGVGDASDPEVSYDGKKIVFSMRCPASNPVTIDGVPACTGRWNIWEYDMSAGGFTGGTYRRLTSSTDDDDVDPYYLPAGRGFVFSSNRQTKSRINQALGQTYYALDEYERERVFNLHTMNAEGESIEQISFNQSHDRNPVVKPDGTNMFVFYGAQSPGNSFLHPREMDPNGPHNGYVASSLMPLSRTQEGGGLMFINAASYSEQNTPADTSIPATGGQVQGLNQALNTGTGVSRFGRITTPYPLWDGTNRVLVAYRPCEVRRNGVVVSCATLSAEELERLNDRDRMAAQIESDELQDNAPASYAIYMFDPVPQTFLIVAPAPQGFMLTDPIPLQPRREPNVIEPTLLDDALAANDLATIEVRSVYDTDGLRRMGEPMFTAADLPGSCSQGIALTTPADTRDTRAQVADLLRIKDPADPAYHCTPVRFVRATRAVAPPSGTTGLRQAIGETEFEQQQILGYAPVEPDGSFKLQVPADIPLALSIVDAKGRAFQTHTNWIQVRPGERRTCDGCHSPRRGASLNSGSVVNTMPAALNPALVSQRDSGETMAALRTRLDSTRLQLQTDMLFIDDWADTPLSGVTARAPIAFRYTGNANTADDLASAVPANGIINYPDHIQPLWTRDRGANTCTTCHQDTTVLDLRANVAGTGRLTSYEELLVGDPELDDNGQPVTTIRDGVPVLERGPALVETSSSAASTAGQARKSRLTEILFGETLLAGADARTAHPSPPGTAPDHSTLLNAAEKRLVAEWMDLGGQYYNNPFAAGSTVRTVTSLSEATFEAQVFPILRSTCAASCHQAVGSDPAVPPGASFRANRFVLTGDPEGDFNVTLTMISDTCTAAANYLLSRPSTVPHPAGATGQTAAVLPVGSAGYNTIANWITSGCTP